MIVHPETGERLQYADDDLFLIVDAIPFGLKGKLLMRRAADRRDLASCAHAAIDGEGDEEYGPEPPDVAA